MGVRASVVSGIAVCLAAAVATACTGQAGADSGLEASIDSAGGVPRLSYPGEGGILLPWSADTAIKIGDVLEHHGLPYVVSGHPTMFTFLIADHQPKDYRDWAASNHELYDKIVWELLELGILPDPDSREPWFMAQAHSEQDVAETLNMFDDAVGAALKNGHH